MKFHKVTHLEHTGMQEMMDLEVLSDFHGFTASNFLVHNCTGSDCTLMSLITINKWLKETGKRSVIFITVHDSIGLDCPKDEIVEVGTKVKHVMENLAQYNEKYKFLGDVPIVSECEIGYSYGESFELDNFEEAMERITKEGVDGILQEFLAKKHEMSEDPNPETGRSYRDCWELQKPIFMQALQMHKGRFKHRLIVLCWMRGLS